MNGDGLKRARYDAGLTSKELAAVAGVAVDTITNAENGQMPQAPTAKKIADALGVKPSDLFFDEPAEAAA